MKKIKIHPSFFIFIILAFVVGLQKELLLVLISFLVHEIGHYFIIKIFKMNINSIDVYPFGGILIYENKNDFIYKGLLISLGGVIFNFIFYLIALLLGFHSLMFLNLFFIVINLLPLYPLDGGNITILFLSYFLPYKIARKIAFILSIVFTVLLSLLLINYLDSLFSWIFISFIIFNSIKGLIYLDKEYEKLVLIKYLSPNYNFKKYKTKFWTNNLVDSLFHQRILEFDFSTFTVSEEEVLRKFYINKKRL